METPETNVKLAALNLMRHKALINLAQGRSGGLYFEDVNEILVVAGLPVIIPDALNAQELKVIKVEKEESNGNTV